MRHNSEDVPHILESVPFPEEEVVEGGDANLDVVALADLL